MYSINFTQGQGDWTISDKELGTASYVWQQNATYGMKASAYVNKTNVATESWLISPAIDLTSATEATIKVNHALNFLNGNKNPLAVKVSTDNGTNWSDLALGMPAGTSWTFQDDELAINDYAGKTIQIAFIYKSSTEVAPTYELKTVTITGNGKENPGEVVEAEEISVADAITLCEGMADNTYSEKTYLVKGVASTVYPYDTQYNNQTFYFGAEAGAQKGSTLEVYRGSIAAPGVAEGDKITVTGKLGVRTTKAGDRSIGFQAGAVVEKINDTAIKGTTVAEKAVKTIENGQLVIIRNGVKYNAVGSVVE